MSRFTLSTIDGQSLIIPIETLDPISFSPFGTVIVSPFGPDLHSVTRNRTTSSRSSEAITDEQIPSPKFPSHQPRAVLANQGTALKTAPIGPLVQNYPELKDDKGEWRKVEGKMSLFSCFPRQPSTNSLDTNDEDITITKSTSTSTKPDVNLSGMKKKLLPLKILERHPYTTQTFCPLALEPTQTPIRDLSKTESSSRFLVVVAPNDDTTESQLPALNQIRAFISTSPPSQAVTYASGTWHAPMIVLGQQRIDFLVTQFVNGVPEDECQEVDIIGNGVWLDLDGIDVPEQGMVKLGYNEIFTTHEQVPL